MQHRAHAALLLVDMNDFVKMCTCENRCHELDRAPLKHIRQEIHGCRRLAEASASHGRLLRTVFTVAAATMVDRKMIGLVTQSVASFIKLYLLLLFVRVLLTWFPNVNWMRQPWTMLRQVTDPYLNLFRNLIPPVMGQVDFTPILGFMVLQFLARVLSSDAGLGKF